MENCRISGTVIAKLGNEEKKEVMKRKNKLKEIKGGADIH